MTGGATTSSIALDLDWTELGRIIALIAERVRATGVPDVVVGVLRGGMVPAVMLAHQLGVRRVRAVEATRTLADGPNAPKTVFPVVAADAPLGQLAGLDVLLVDDVVGTGLTIGAVAALLTAERPMRLRQAVVVVNTTNWAASVPQADPFELFDHVGTACAGWVRFPWENR